MGLHGHLIWYTLQALNTAEPHNRRNKMLANTIVGRTLDIFRNPRARSGKSSSGMLKCQDVTLPLTYNCKYRMTMCGLPAPQGLCRFCAAEFEDDQYDDRRYAGSNISDEDVDVAERDETWADRCQRCGETSEGKALGVVCAADFLPARGDWG